MKKQEAVYRDILYNAMEKKEFFFTQSELSKRLNLSLSNINIAIKRLSLMGAVKIEQRGFKVIDIRKILYFWASVRNLEKDILFKVRIEAPVREIERMMPNAVFTGYTAYKLKFNEVPADYSEVYAYADEEELGTIKKRIANLRLCEDNPNLIVLKKDDLLKIYNSIPIAQIFADLWNMKEWYAKEFIKSIEDKKGVM
jgi:predicted transcriptional regulator